MSFLILENIIIQLKQNQQDYNVYEELEISVNGQNIKMGDIFDINKFNSFYNENKIEDENNNGYKEWMENNKCKNK